VEFLPFGWGKKPYEKVPCDYVVQEYDPADRGWKDVTESSPELPKVQEAKEFARAGCHYRCIARALEDDLKEGIKAGTYVGVPWKFYEPLPGGLKPAEKPKVPKEEKTRVLDPSEIMDRYVDQLDRTLKPVVKFGEVMARLRDSLVGPPPSGEGQEGGNSYEIPPLEYDGKAPWFLHPQVAHTIANEMKGVIDHLGQTMERVLHGAGAEAPTPTGKEEEEPLLPAMPTGREEAPSEEVEEREEEGEEELVHPPEVEKLEAPSAPARPEEGERLVPSLFDEEEEEEPASVQKQVTVSLEVKTPCGNCGEVKPLLPNGLCEECNKKLSEPPKAEQKKRRKKE